MRKTLFIGFSALVLGVLLHLALFGRSVDNTRLDTTSSVAPTNMGTTSSRSTESMSNRVEAGTGAGMVDKSIDYADVESAYDARVSRE